MSDSIQRAVSDGTLVRLDVAIQHQGPAANQDVIAVYYDDFPAAPGTWSWLTGENAIGFTPAVPVGVEVMLVRTTGRSELWHQYNKGAAFTARTLDESLTQNLRIVQEAMEQGLSGDYFKDINMHGNQITNLAPGTDPNHAATVGQLAAATDITNTVREYPTLTQARAAAALLPDGVTVITAVDNTTLKYTTAGGLLAGPVYHSGDGPIQARWFMNDSPVNGVASNQAAIEAAVAYAKSVDTPLWWARGTYVSTGTIPGFWDVQHSGPGVLLRGVHTFKFNPRNKQENVLHVATLGSNTYDGLTPDYPFSTTQAAFNVLTQWGFLDGTWIVRHAAGEYLGSRARARLGHANDLGDDPNVDPYKYDGVSQKNFIVVEGADVGYDPRTNPRPQPTTVFEAEGATIFGLQLQKVQVLLKNMKFRQYQGGSSAAVAMEAGHLRTENVHTALCRVGLQAYMSRFEVKGGAIYGDPSKSYTGIRTMFLTKHEVGEQSSGGGRGPLISFCNYGMHAQEGATGHSDYVDYEDCNYGIYATVNSRVNYTGSTFKRCDVGVRADANSVVYANPGSANFYMGTADACKEMMIIAQGATSVNRDLYSNTGFGVAYLNAPRTHTGSGTSTPILTWTVPAGTFAPVIQSVRKAQVIKVTAFGTMSGTSGAKQLKVRLGNTLVGAVSTGNTDQGAWRFDGEVLFNSPTTQVGCARYSGHLNTLRVDVGSANNDMRIADVPLTFEVQLANASDTVVIQHCAIEIWG